MCLFGYHFMLPCQQILGWDNPKNPLHMPTLDALLVIRQVPQDQCKFPTQPLSEQTLNLPKSKSLGLVRSCHRNTNVLVGGHN